MPYALQYTTASGKYVSYPAIAIASGENFSIECVASIDASGIVRLIGNPSATFTSRAWLQQNATPNVRLTNAAGASADWNFSFVLGTYYKVRFVRTGSTTELFIDNVSQGTRTLSGSFSFEWFFAQSTTFGAPCTVRYFEFISNAGTRLYRNDSGTGSIWPDVNNPANNATQVGAWPANDSEWVFYSSGASYTLTADGATFSYSGGIALTTYNRLLSADGGSFGYSGGAASTLLNRRIAADGATFDYSGGASALLYSRALQAAGGSFSYSGGIATFVYNPITGYVLNADGGIFSYAGGEAALSFNQNYPTANPNDYTVSAYLSVSSSYTARLSESSTINAIISASSTINARLN